MITRYSVVTKTGVNGVFIEKNSLGTLVEYTDYEKLKNENVQLKKDNEELESFIERLKMMM